jgi:hypothetical protein
VDQVVRRAVVALSLAAALAIGPSVGPAVGAQARSKAPSKAESSTTLPVDQNDRSVIPAPNSGREPSESGDRGGWAQLTLFGLMAAGSAVIFGRVLWAGHQRSRAGKVP